ncbi:MAG: DUF4129 domain-containing protein [Deltaproteobacteria bacterium]|nr:MAG: DUF4129 domain-containing protein [Deltaproteobacteria bacterium]
MSKQVFLGLCASLLVFFTLVWVVPSAYAFSDADRKKAKKTAKQVHKDGGYGKTLGLEEPAKPERNEGCMRRNGCMGCSGCGGCDETLKPLFGVTQGCAQLTPWVFLGIALFLLLLWLRQYIRRLEATRKVEIETVESVPTVLGMEMPVDADPLDYAKLGDWEKAIAALLLRSLRNVGWKPEGKGKSQTPREILRTLSSSDPRRLPLQELLFLTERVRFGGEEATEILFGQAQGLSQTVEGRAG